MKTARGWLLQLAVVVVADLFIGYLVVEVLNAFDGARYALPFSEFLIVTARLSPLTAGALLGAGLVATASAYAYWLWRYTPEVLSRYLAGRKPEAKQAGKEGLRVADLQLAENPEAKPFVDVVQLEGYPLNVYAAVTKEEGREGYTYTVIEPTLSEQERARLAELKKLLIDELDVDLRSIESTEKAEAYLSGKVKDLVKKYGYKIPAATMTKMLYYLTRDYIHLGKIEPLMRDKLIEDISCDGSGIPIYIWYRDYESIPTNILFETDEELDTYVSKLAYSAGKHVSLAEPIVDASLADGSRIHLTYGKEVTQKGSTFTIRKFRVDPLTIVDLIRYGTMSSEVAAYLWYLIEKKLALLVAGGTASGKSIPYHEKVWVYMDGRGSLVSIGSLYDALARSGEASKEGSYETISCEGVETAAFGRDLRVGRHAVKSVVRHSAPKATFRVRTRSGRVVEATGDHSLFTLVDGRVSPFPASRLGAGMFVAVPRTLPDASPAEAEINLLELLRGAESDVCVENAAEGVGLAVERLGLPEAARLLGMRAGSVREGVERGSLVAPVGGFGALTEAARVPVDPSSLTLRAKGDASFKLPGSLAATRALARFLGYRAAEGLQPLQPEAETRKDVVASGIGAFGARSELGEGSDSVLVKSVVAALIGGGAGSGGTRIPRFIMEGGNETLAEFLRGYFTLGSSVGPAIEVPTEGEEMAHQLQYALLRFGIVARTAPKAAEGRACHMVTVNGEPNLARFEERIGFLDEGRQAMLREAVLAEGEAGRDRLPQMSQTTGGATGQGALLTFVGGTGARGSPAQMLSALARSDIFWDEVAEVSKVDHRGEFVYDLEVPGAENFVGGSGGVFLHNTTSLNALSMFIEPGEKIVSVEDSVTRDAEILVKEGEQVRKVAIGDYIDESLLRSRTVGDRGHELARVDGLQVLTSDASGRTLWSECTALIRHRVRKRFVSVTTGTGRSITVTADHSLFSLSDDGTVGGVLAGALVPGSFVAAPRAYPHEAARHDLEHGSVEPSRWSEGRGRDNGNGLLLAGLRARGEASLSSFQSQIPLSEGVAFLAGLWLTHGFYGDGAVGFSAEEVRVGAIARELGLSLSRQRGEASPLIESEPLRVYFESVLGLKGDGSPRRVPDLFFSSDEATLVSLLRGFFTGAGSVGAGKIEVDSASRALLLDLQTLLLRFGVYLVVGSKRSARGRGGVGTFRGRIAGAAQVARFKERVGFGDAREPGEARERSVDPIPLNRLLAGEILEQLPGVARTALGRRLRAGLRRGAVERQALLDLGRARPEYRRCRGFDLAQGGYYFDRVVAVTIEDREEEVYDLSVPETGRFIANNLLCHNTPELNLPHENWIQSVTRGVGTAGEITMFDLLKASLRQRPDVLIVGEVRGEEAFTLMQSIATGHGGLGTIHADSVEAVINRLTTEPMNIPRSLVGTTLDCIVMQLKLRMGDRSVRRVVAVTEVVGHDARSDEIILNDAFKWDPVLDKFSFTGRSKLFDKITQRFGTRPEEIRREIDGRRTFLDWLVAKNIRTHTEVSNMVREFYAGPYAVINKAKAELEGLKA